ncbi:polymer-forming cytoskeletal protein [Massilia sp. YIM B04103]|uniref:polymer-forming cytoskeletal protein n=1 Tax=Massilia sp. YIM B04103 TaxID=2963106 RepID=UPI00210A9F73|nr:polymer-forming cytoskeletal protein [Massilia sp. YIM B04103]
MDSRLSSLLPKFAAVPLAFLLYVASSLAMADTYHLPSDLSRAPFNCSGSGQDYNCGSIDLDKDAVLVLNGPIRLQVSGNLSTDKNLSSVNNGYNFDISVGGSVDLKKDVDVTMNLTVGGSVEIAKDARFTGNITAGGNATFAKDSIYDGNVTVGGFLSVDKNTYITGTCRAGATNFSGCGAKPPASTLHHIRINHNGVALTCTPASITVYACVGGDSGGNCTAYTGGVSGNIKTNSGLNVKFEIPQNGSSASVALGITKAGTVTLSADGYAASNGYSCWNSGSTSCDLVFKDSAFLVTVPNHIAGSDQTAKIEAVQKDQTSNRCVPGFAGKRDVNLSCTYSNPSSGSIKLNVGGAQFACGTAATAVNLTFDNNGIATPALRYDDVGALALSASIPDPDVHGSGSFVAAPAGFSIAPNENNPHKAGLPFTADITALNAKNEATPNFGKESSPALVRVDFNKCPFANGTGSTNAVFTSGLAQAFSNGKAKSSAMSWSEVGTGNLIAYLDSNPASTAAPLAYLNTSFVPRGSTAGANSSCTQIFVPHHFDIVYTNPRKFWYSGQSMERVRIAAKAYANPLSAATTTSNYMLGAAANAKVKLAAYDDATTPATVPAAIGTLDITEVNGSKFQSGTKGEAEFTPTFTFKQPKTSPLNLRLRATDDSTVSSANGREPLANIRLGRLRFSNTFAPTLGYASMAIRAEYWGMSSWILNSDDNYTILPLTAFAKTQSFQNVKVTPVEAKALENGSTYLQLYRAATGKAEDDRRQLVVDVAINLGVGGPDKSCLPNHPASTGAALTWLRSSYGTCPDAAAQTADPFARAYFGVSSPENRARVHVREVFN